MRYRPFLTMLWTALASAFMLAGQVTLNPSPSRVLGHPRLQFSTANPNLVEGRELYSPQGVAVDTSASPPILYVADTGNNRIMVWKNATRFANGVPADFIIGQKDVWSTLPLGPGTTFSAGLNSPTGLAVKDGNLYVADSGNNRILRFPSPAQQTDQFPDMVIGQFNFNSRTANQGGTPNEKTVFLASSSAVYRTSLVFDAAGNLWVADPGNSRVLRFPAQAINQGASGPSADLVLGQVDFLSVAPALQVNVTSQQVKDRIQVPAGLAFDSTGRLYVSDALARVLVFAPPFLSGMPARRILGVILPPKPGQPAVLQITIDRTTFRDPEGIFMAPGDLPCVVDSQNSRILVFDPFPQWAAETDTFVSPPARAVIGQAGDFTNKKSNNGQPEASAATLSGPVGVTLAGGELYVADAGNHRLIVLPQDSVTFFGPAVRLAGQDQFAFNSPNLIEGREFDFILQTSRGTLADAGIVVDVNSDPPHLYVADTYNNRILGFRDLRKARPGDRADLVIGQPDMYRSLCNYPSNDPDKPNQTSLCQPVGLAVDGDGNLWVADGGNGRVLRFPTPFAREGNLPAADLVLGQSSFTAKITDPTARTMSSPYGLAFAGDNGLLVSDQIHNRVLFFPKTGAGFTSGMAATKVFGQPGFTTFDPSTQQTPEDNRLRSPRHISADTDARIYVADAGNSRILIFDQVGNTPAADARAVLTLTGFSGPRGLFVSPLTGEIWVADTNNARTLRFPRFDQLPFGTFKPNATLTAPAATVAVTQDQYGDLLVADASSRVAIHYPGLTALNGANFFSNRALAPGVVASVFPLGNTFGTDTKVFTELPNPVPLPTDLADIQVLVNETPAPLYFVSPQQINLFVPTGAPAGGTAEFQVVRKSTGQILGSGPVQMNVASPGLFTANSQGTGQVMALNQDNTVNSPTNPAARGTVIALFGTGQGAVPGAPADGDVAQGPVPTPDNPRVIIGTCFVDECGEAGPHVLYSGLAPGLVGVWQINVKIPMPVTPDTKAKIAVLHKNIPSTGGDSQKVDTTIAIK